MRKRSMSVFVPRDNNHLSRKFEGVTSDHEAHSDSEEEEELATEIHMEETKVPLDEELSDGWGKHEYDTLVAQLKEALPKKDVRKWKTTLQAIDWGRIKVGKRSSEEVERIAKEVIGKTRSFRTLTELLDEVPDVVTKMLSATRPKPPITAYSLFVKEKLPQLREEHKDMKVQQIFKLIPDQYKALSAKKRRRYEADAAKMKEEYQVQLHKFYQDHPELSPKKGYKPKKEPLKTPFQLFYQERRDLSSNISFQQARKEWENLPLKSKVTYIQRSFEVQGDSDTKLVNKKEMEMLGQSLGKPEFCGRNVYEFYRRKMKSTPGKEQEAKVRTDYKNLSEPESEALKEEYQQARAKFVDQYRKYIKKLPQEKQQAEIDFLLTISEKKSKKVKSEKANAAAAADEDAYLEDPPAAESTTINKKPPAAKNSKVAAIKKEHKSDHSDADSVDRSSPKKKSSKTAAAPSPAAASVASPTKRKQQPSATKSKHNSQSASSSDDREEDNRAPAKRPTVAATPTPASPTKNGKKRISDEELQPAAAAKKTKVKKEADAPKEPEKPPKDAEEYYRQHVYKGKVGKHKESYANLSTAKKRAIVDQLKSAQKQYIIDFEIFLKSLPKEEIRKYIQQKAATPQKAAEHTEDSDDDDDDDDDEEDASSSEEEEDDE